MRLSAVLSMTIGQTMVCRSTGVDKLPAVLLVSGVGKLTTVLLASGFDKLTAVLLVLRVDELTAMLLALFAKMQGDIIHLRVRSVVMALVVCIRGSQAPSPETHGWSLTEATMSLHLLKIGIRLL